MRKAIVFLYNLTFILAPLIFYARTSEVFEFNKMVLVYSSTILITSFWAMRMIIEKKFVFRRTILDMPLLIFLVTQLISTLLSIDSRTSWLGYYSRFNGGLFSSFAYALLYWGMVANLNSDDAKKTITHALIPSAVAVSIYGILEHFGHSFSCLLIVNSFTDDCWVQDVRTRVFATLGQPNWMAAYLTALIPITWAKFFENIESKSKVQKFIWLIISGVFFWAILYTKSRSALIALGIAAAAFGIWTLLKQKGKIKKVFVPMGLLGLMLVSAIALTGTPWTPSIPDLLNKKETNITSELNATSEGGTESGDIRKIVWKGALNIWKANPIFGTGPETFAYTYYMYRPKEHNLVSEWDFLYNKAHNEYLNYLANTGLVGLAGYLGFVALSIYGLRKNVGLLAGYLSILVTNFFGFSVVVTQLMLFLYPAIAFVLVTKSETEKENKLVAGQKVSIVIVVLLTLYLLSLIYRYWTADLAYSKAKAELEMGQIANAAQDFNSAILKTPKEPLYHNRLAQIYAAFAVASHQQKDASAEAQLISRALDEAETALGIAPKNFVILQDRVNIYSDLGKIDADYMSEAIRWLEYLTLYAPNYAKTYYKLGQAYFKVGNIDKAIEALEKAVELKPNYKEAIDLLNKVLAQKSP